MRLVVGHIISWLCVGALLAMLDSYFVPVVEADDGVGLGEFACFFDESVRNCLRLLMIDDDPDQIKNFGCCKMVKKCDHKVACVFSRYCRNIDPCNEDEDDDEDDDFWDIFDFRNSVEAHGYSLDDEVDLGEALGGDDDDHDDNDDDDDGGDGGGDGDGDSS
jgi:hypothetical protein